MTLSMQVANDSYWVYHENDVRKRMHKGSCDTVLDRQPDNRGYWNGPYVDFMHALAFLRMIGTMGARNCVFCLGGSQLETIIDAISGNANRV